MADSNSTTDQWLETQKRYWDAWTDMARRGIEAASPAQQAANPWAAAMEQWWKAIAPAAPGPTQDVFTQMVSLGKSYFAMAEALSKPVASGDIGEMVENWTGMMSEAFGKASQGLNPLAAFGAGKGSREGMAFWDLPFDTLSRTLSASSPVPGDLLKAFEGDVPANMRTQMDRFLAAPAIGYGREYQEHYQKFGRLVLDYEKAMGRYQSGMAELGTKSLDAFHKRLTAAADDAGPINSVRQIYNLWVDACEEVYADYAMSDEYARRYGAMVNALMAVKHQGARLVDEWLETMNMPTRNDISGLQRRLHDSRNEVRQLARAAEMMRTELETLSGVTSELETLRAEVAELRKAILKVAASAGPSAAASEGRAPKASPAKAEADADADATGSPAKPPAAAKSRTTAKPAAADKAKTTAKPAARPKTTKTKVAARKTGTTRRTTQS